MAQKKAAQKRTPVSLTDGERDEIRKAMIDAGIRSIADYLRMAALQLARKAADAK